MEGPRVLVVEDDPILRRLAVKLLEGERYKTLDAEDGQTGLSLAFTYKPDLILLDRVLPDLDGMEVLRRLRAHFVTTHIPVIMVTSRDELNDRIEGLGSGADDYVGKPFDSRELIARVAAIIRRSESSLGADPLSKLPGNTVIRAHVRRKLEAGSACSIGYVDLDNFKAYVDNYGFEAAGNIIKKTAQILYNAVMDHGDPEDFLGHIGGDDFLLISTPRKAEEVSARLVEAFDAFAPQCYSAMDRERGYIEARDRYGAQRRFPLVSISVAIIDLPEGASPDPVPLAEFAGHCKSAVKRDRGSGWKRFPYGAEGKGMAGTA